MSRLDEIKDNKIEDFLKFLEVTHKTCKERGKQYEFECPLCKGVAQGFKNTYNGHLWAKCKKCDMNIIE